MAIRRVGVVGAGTMGNGIAHVFARSGYQVMLCDIEQKFLDRALATIGKNLDREVAKNKISDAQKSDALQRISPITDRSRLAVCDFIVEVIQNHRAMGSDQHLLFSLHQLVDHKLDQFGVDAILDLVEQNKPVI